MAAIKFEKALSRLETIVTELEAGELSLDDSLKIFEEGVDDAERKVEILVQDKDGRKRIQAFSLEEPQSTES
jgi:exodeoxyribonuclease VII small subunit